MQEKTFCAIGGGWGPQKKSGGSRQQDRQPQMSIPHAAGVSVSSVDRNAIQQAICKKYTGVAIQAAGFFSYPVGREGAQLLNYDPALLAEVPEPQLQSFCGVGNPCAIQPIPAGSIVVDIGCGCGFDCYVASRAIGDSGHVTGIDITEAMVVRARENIAALGASNVEVLHANGIHMPVEDAFADVVISNGVFNLAPDKELLFAEIFRILKPGGRLQFADIILVRELPPDLAASAESWSQWIGGAIPGRDQVELMKKAGFVEVAQLGMTPIQTSPYTAGCTFKATRPEK